MSVKLNFKKKYNYLFLKKKTIIYQYLLCSNKNMKIIFLQLVICKNDFLKILNNQFIIYLVKTTLKLK